MDTQNSYCDECGSIIQIPHHLPIKYVPPESSLKYVSVSQVSHIFKQLEPISDQDPGKFILDTDVCTCSPECLLQKALKEYKFCLTNIYLKYPNLIKE